MAVVFHDPNASREYWIVFDLGGDLLSGISAVVIDNVSDVSVDWYQVNSQALTDRAGNQYPPNTVLVIWLSGGSVGSRGLLTVSYETVAGRVDDAEVVIEVADD